MSAFSHVIEWSTFMPKYLLLPSDELAKEGQRFLKGLTAAEKGKTRCEGWKVTWIPARPHAPPSPPLNSLQMEWHDMSSNAVQQIHTYTNTYKNTHTNTQISAPPPYPSADGVTWHEQWWRSALCWRQRSLSSLWSAAEKLAHCRTVSNLNAERFNSMKFPTVQIFFFIALQCSWGWPYLVNLVFVFLYLYLRLYLYLYMYLCVQCWGVEVGRSDMKRPNRIPGQQGVGVMTALCSLFPPSWCQWCRWWSRWWQWRWRSWWWSQWWCRRWQRWWRSWWWQRRSMAMTMIMRIKVGVMMTVLCSLFSPSSSLSWRGWDWWGCIVMQMENWRF